MVYITRICYRDGFLPVAFAPSFSAYYSNGCFADKAARHQENMSVECTCIPPYTPLLYSENRVYRGVPFFLIFDPKHR